MCEELDAELERGNTAINNLIDHVNNMGAAEVEQTVERHGYKWVVKVAIIEEVDDE